MGIYTRGREPSPFKCKLRAKEGARFEMQGSRVDLTSRRALGVPCQRGDDSVSVNRLPFLSLPGARCPSPPARPRRALPPGVSAVQQHQVIWRVALLPACQLP
jgi:hypothetical protein